MTTKRYVDGVKYSDWPPYIKRLWQRNYWEHIIRNERALDAVRRYIADNPQRWDLDRCNAKACGADRLAKGLWQTISETLIQSLQGRTRVYARNAARMKKAFTHVKAHFRDRVLGEENVNPPRKRKGEILPRKLTIKIPRRNLPLYFHPHLHRAVRLEILGFPCPTHRRLWKSVRRRKARPR